MVKPFWAFAKRSYFYAMPRSEYLPLNTQRQALLLGIIVKVIKSNVLHDEFSLVVEMRTCAAHYP